MPALDAVEVSGSGDAMFAEFESLSLRLSVTGSGDVEGSEISVGALAAGVSGSGDITLEGCASESADVSITGSGDITLRGASDDQPAGARSRCTERPMTSGPASWSCRSAAPAAPTSPAASRLGRGALPGSPARVDVRTSGSGRVIKDE